MLEKLRRNFPILLLAAGHGAVDFYLLLLAVVAPGLAIHLRIPLGDLVMLMGAGTLLNNAVQMLAGYVMGSRNLAWTLWFGVLVSGLSVFMGVVPGFYSLAAIILIGAVGTGLYHPEGALSAHDVSGDKAYLGVPLFMAGGACFTAIGTPLSIWIADTYGYPTLAWLIIPGLLVAATLFFRHQGAKQKHPSLVLRPRSRRITKIGQGVISFWPLLGVTICYGVLNGLFLSLLASHYELVFGPGARSWAGWILMIMGTAGSFCSFVWSALARKHGFYTIACLTQIIALPLLVFMAFPPSPALGFVIAIPLSLVSSMAVFPISVPLARNASGLTQGMRTGILMGGTAGLSSIAVMIAGALLRRGMPSSWLMLAIAACCLASILLSAQQLLATRLRRPAAPQS